MKRYKIIKLYKDKQRITFSQPMFYAHIVACCRFSSARLLYVFSYIHILDDDGLKENITLYNIRIINDLCLFLSLNLKPHGNKPYYVQRPCV